MVAGELTVDGRSLNTVVIVVVDLLRREEQMVMRVTIVDV